MPHRDIVVVGASAGGLEALQTLVRSLPAALPAALLVVWHIPAHSLGVLPQVLERAGLFPAAHAVDGEPVLPGHIFVAPPDRHMLIEDGRIRLTHGPKENHFRPAVDPLFRSAAYSYGTRAIGIVLTGALDDGTAGLWAIKDRGGVTIAQEPSEALYPSMPQSAIEYGVDYICRVTDMGALLQDLTRQPIAEAEIQPPSPTLEIEHRIAMENNALEAGVLELGTPSPLTCPECHGALSQITTGGILRFRCHTGHAFSANTLSVEVTESLEETLWSALRTIDEIVMLSRQMADVAQSNGNPAEAARLQQHSANAQQQGQVIRQMVVHQSQQRAARHSGEERGAMGAD